MIASSPFTIDWGSQPQVIAYAKHLGKGMTVVYNPATMGYNIIHTIREDELLGMREVIHRT